MKANIRGRPSKLVFVEWEDSHSPDGWVAFSDLRHDPIVCRSVGWTVREDEDFLVLSPHIGATDGKEFDQGLGILTIPKRAILKRRTLAEPRRKGPR